VRPLAPKLVDPQALKAQLDRGERVQVIDVRGADEVAFCRIDGSTHIPMHDIQARLGELDPKLPTVVYCHHGVRSQMAAAFLLQQGFADVANLRGGIDHWAAAVDPTLPRY